MSTSDGVLTRAVVARSDEVLRLKRGMGRLKMQLREVREAEPEADDPGSRVNFHKNGGRVYKGTFNNSTCLNCESTSHVTRECPNQCILR